MNVLLLYPETPYSFWTLRETNFLAGAKALAPPLGLISVAALLPENWGFRLRDLNVHPVREEDWAFADVVMITGMIVQRDSLLSLIAEAKRRGKVVVAGGPYVTSVPDDVRAAGCDLLVHGEGEELATQLVQAVQGESDRKGDGPMGDLQAATRPPMEKAPVPRFDLLELDAYQAISIQTSRGCPFSCEFCDIINLFGRTPRYKTPEQVIAELEALYDLGWRSTIFICDDNFIGNKSHAHALLDAIIPWMKAHGEPFLFFTQASVNLGQDQSLMDKMTEANFADVFIGVESPDDAVLANMHKQQNIKNPLGESLQAINANGLTVLGSFIIGFDGEAPGAGQRIVEFVERLGLPSVMLNMLQALPNTAMWDRLEAEGRLLPQEERLGISGWTMNFTPSRPKEEILAEYAAAIDALYTPERFLARAYRAILAMRPTRSAAAKKASSKQASSKGASTQGAGASATSEDAAQAQAAPTHSATGKEAAKRVPLAHRIRDMRGFALLAWRQGIVPRYRLQFWRQLIGVVRHNPSRLVRYLIICAFGENLFALRRHILQEVSSQLPDRLTDGLPGKMPG